MVIDKNGNIYVVTEASCEIYKFICDNDKLKFIQKKSILSRKKENNYTGCAIKIDLNSEFIYVSIRGLNSIAVFSIQDNNLKMIQNVDCNGECPRDIVLDPTNHYLLCANQKSNNISIFKVNNGKIIFKNSLSIVNPSCIVVDSDQN